MAELNVNGQGKWIIFIDNTTPATEEILAIPVGDGSKITMMQVDADNAIISCRECGYKGTHHSTHKTANANVSLNTSSMATELIQELSAWIASAGTLKPTDPFNTRILTINGDNGVTDTRQISTVIKIVTIDWDSTS